MSNFNESDHDILVAHDVKLEQICKSVGELKVDNKDLRKDMKSGFGKIGEKLDAGIVACPTNRANCRKEIDKEIDDERKLADEKINKKVDWKYFGGVITLLTIAFAVLKYTA